MEPSHDRRRQRSANPWRALQHLFEARGAALVLADDDGLPLVAAGLAADEAEERAVDTLGHAEAALRTGSGVTVRLHSTLASEPLARLRADVQRILQAA